MKNIKIKHSAPQNNEEWLIEIARAYLDASKSKSAGTLSGNNLDENDLYHFAPALCLKFRGIKKNEQLTKKVTEAALLSYAATEDTAGAIFTIPQLSFAFCYLAAHFELDIIEENSIIEIMDFLVENITELFQRTASSGD